MISKTVLSLMTQGITQMTPAILVTLTIVVLLFLIFRFLRERGISHINSYHTVKRGGIVLYWL